MSLGAKQMITQEQWQRIQNMRDTNKSSVLIIREIEKIDPNYNNLEQSIFMWLKRNKP